MPNKNSQLPEPPRLPGPHVPANTWIHMVVFLCIWFLIVVLILVYFTVTGSPQAGLLEVGISILIFIFLFHLVVKFFPSITKILTYVFVIGFGIALISVNYHFLNVVKRDASLEQLLVGDLLVNKIVKTFKKEPAVIVAEKEASQYEKPLPAMSLDQLKKLVADPIRAGFEESLSIARVGSTAQEGFLSPVEKYQIGLPLDISMKEEISHLKFMIKGYDSTIQEIPGKEDARLLPMVTLMSVVKGKIKTGGEKYEIGLPVRSLNTKVSDLKYATERWGSMIRETLDGSSLTLLPELKFIQEPLNVTLEEPEVQSPVFETIASISLIKLSEPLQEGYLLID